MALISLLIIKVVFIAHLLIFKTLGCQQAWLKTSLTITLPLGKLHWSEPFTPPNKLEIFFKFPFLKLTLFKTS